MGPPGRRPELVVGDEPVERIVLAHRRDKRPGEIVTGLKRYVDRKKQR
ncbi:MAG: hypothetical protein GX932_02685 [Methanomicrobiales archaeon]|nr:hypothetical protein [Methanomicrobiales archaeon]